jgi:hypothetical protein
LLRVEPARLAGGLVGIACGLVPQTAVRRALRRGIALTAARLAIGAQVAAAQAGAAQPAKDQKRHPHAHRKAPHRIAIGAYIPDADRQPELVDRFAEQVGRSPVILSFYRNWGPRLLDSRQLEVASSHGAVPMLTWEPWGQDEEGVSLGSIANGLEDGYLNEAAREAAAWGNPIFLRFAHEMNGNWYPWGWERDGNSPELFVAAWRHVVEVFRTAGASNVRWTWCPYVSNMRLWQFRAFYPGDAWVDWACMDGFNWGSYRTWQSFDQVFGDTYRTLTRLTSRPIVIGETGVNDAGGNKPRWITRSLRRSLPRYSHIRALVWYNAADRRADFRVDSSTGALSAVRLSFGEKAYASNYQRVINMPARLKMPPYQPGKRGKGRPHGR